MKKFKFSLEKILDLKNQFLKNLKNDLMRLKLDLKNKEDEINDLNRKIADTDAKYVEKTKESISSVEIVSYKDYLDRLYMEKKELFMQERIIINKIENKKKDVISMNMEISTLEKLREKKMDDYNYKVQKAEEQLIEEFISMSSVFEKSSNNK